MGRYKILLVDDEEEVRTSIIRKVPWAELGFEVAGDAENGEDALGKIVQLKPDLVMTDIKMPYMDGLELAKRIRSDNNNVEIVIFSGFDEFEYAKQAIRLHVLEYILKPVNVEEMKEILGRVRKRMDDKIEEKRNIEKLRENYVRSLPILKEHFLTDLIYGRLQEEEIAEGMRRYNLLFHNAQFYTGASVTIKKTAGRTMDELSLHKEEELLPLSVRNVLEEYLGGRFEYEIFGMVSEVNLVVGLSGKQQLTELMDVLQSACYACHKILELDVTVGMGNCYRDMSMIGQSYREAKDAAGYRALIGEGSVIFIGDMEGTKDEQLVFDTQMAGELTAAVKFGEESKIREVIEEVVQKMEVAKVHESSHQVYILSVFNSILQLIQSHGLGTIEVWGVEKQDYFAILSKLNNAANVQNFLINTCLSINQKINSERNNSVKNIVVMATAYIMENFSNPNLSVETVCEYLHISPTYFSSLFKKETGQSYVTYLTDIRMKKAAELLQGTEEKTYVIAASVGYLEPNYFSYVFKKMYGVSPSKYRGN